MNHADESMERTANQDAATGNTVADGGGPVGGRTVAGRRAAVAAALMAAVGLAGCISVPIPQAAADPARFYVLTATTPPGAAADAAAPVVRLLPVEVASYLRGRPMVVRRGEHEVQFREFARWGEPLELGVARVVREELVARGAVAAMPTGGVALGSAEPARNLAVRVLACEGAADGSVIFRAGWELAPVTVAAGQAAGGGTVRGEFRAANLRWDGTTEASLAAQLSAAVAGLAGEIAGALKK